jgi:hypothetical protein
MQKHISLCGWAGVILFLLVSQLFAQAPNNLWSRTFGGSGDDWAYSVQQTADVGYIVAGQTTSFGAGSYYNFYLVKTNGCGDTLWTRTYGGVYNDWASSVQQTDDGGYIVAGYTQSFGAGYEDFYLVKTNSQGNALWTRTYGGNSSDQAFCVQQTADGGYIVAGSTYSFGVGGWDFYLVKTNGQGDTVWTRTYGGNNADHSVSVQQTADGGYIAAGETRSFGGGTPNYTNLYLVKTNSQGDTLWTRTYGGSSAEGAYSVRQTADGGYIVAGYTWSFGAGSYDFYLVKTDGEGDTLWTRAYGGSSYDEARSIQQTTDGGYIVAGYTTSFGAGSYDFYLVKTDGEGDTLWTRTYGGSSDERAYSVQQTTNGGYIMAGQTQSFGAGSVDMWLVRTGFGSPDIVSITDVGNDQGRQARIRWNRSAYDDACVSGETITSYSIYRRIDQYLMSGGKKAERENLDWPPGEWEYIKTVPARGEAQYATIVPTLADSTSMGIYWSVFFVSAETSNPLVYFDSAVDSGYSVDNLPPDETILTAMVQTAPGRIHLQWQEIATGGGGQPEQGEIWYHVYGSADPMFTPAPENLLIETQSLEFTHEVGTNQKYFYIIQASDDH